MASNRTLTPGATPPIDRRDPSGPGVLLRAGDFAALMDEFESLRAQVVSDRKPASLDGDELLRTLRKAGVEEVLIEQVAAFIELVSKVEDVVVVDGGAGIGSIVKVQDRRGQTTEYELVGRSLAEPPREQVLLGSPTSKALLGARPGDYVRVTLPNGRQRRVRVINVTPPLAGGSRARVQCGGAAGSASGDGILGAVVGENRPASQPEPSAPGSAEIA